MSVVQLQEHLVRYLCAGHQTDRTTTDDGYLDLVYPDWYMYIETTIVSVLYVIYCLVMYCESLINITTAEVVLFLFANKSNLVDNYGQVFFVNIFQYIYNNV